MSVEQVNVDIDVLEEEWRQVNQENWERNEPFKSSGVNIFFFLFGNSYII